MWVTVVDLNCSLKRILKHHVMVKMNARKAAIGCCLPGKYGKIGQASSEEGK